MNPGVGSAGSLRQRRLAGNASKGGLQLALYRALPRLHLPTVEIGPVVGQGHLPGLQGRGELGGFVQRYLYR
jgi:hypothetical protein